ncbi:MAG: hypothetical protein HY016_10000 [Nitrosomonadales bacterium]|nr:hypothetical protein [Nitrosomonadales bacterium]
MEPQRLRAGQGWEWIKQGYALFIKAPLLWIVLLFICVIAAVGVSSIPVVGEPLVSLLMPVILVGLMVGCHALKQDEELELAHLFSGFKQHTSQLVTLGGITLVSQYLILGVMMMVGGATLVGILMSGQSDTDPNVMMEAITGAGVAVLLGIALFSLLMMAMQFAPMLVFFNNVPPVQAMKLSLRAFLHNIGPMLVYGVTFLILAVLASLPMMLGWVVLLPLVFTSLYASYTALFPLPPETVSVPPEAMDAGDEQEHF